MNDLDSLSIAQEALPRVLFVDDEERILRTMKALFRTKYEVLTTTDGYIALEYMKQNHIHVVVSDQRMPRLTGVEFLRHAKVISPNTLRMLLTGYSDLAAIVGSINDGEVFRFIHKPWDNDDIRKTIQDAVEVALKLEASERPGARLLPDENLPSMEDNILIVSPFRPLNEEVTKLAAGRCPTLRAKSLREVLTILQISPVGVIVAELYPGHGDITLFLKLLKQLHPQIVTVLVSPTMDAELAISLINQAQVFRLLVPPITTELLRTAIGLAVHHYLTFN